jgi:hypothetical protein
MAYIYPVCTSQYTQYVTIIKNRMSIPFVWIILSQCDDNMEQKNAMRGQNTGFLHRKPGRVYSSGPTGI